MYLRENCSLKVKSWLLLQKYQKDNKNISCITSDLNFQVTGALQYPVNGEESIIVVATSGEPLFVCRYISSMFVRFCNGIVIFSGPVICRNRYQWLAYMK